MGQESSGNPQRARTQIRAIKGVRDILPSESALWNRVEQTAREVFGTYNFQEIRLPVVEPAELFARSVGMETDIVSKEMYIFPDPAMISDRNFLTGMRTLRDLDDAYQKNRGGITARAREYVHDAFEHLEAAIERAAQDLVSLRPEATASVVRAYIEHGMHTWPSPVRLYYLGPMFRRERPQKGRYRQFYQIGAEVLGPSDHAGIDAEVIEMLMSYLGRLRLAGATLYVNSIGCKECRPKYVALLRAELEKVKAQLGEDSQRRMETNPLRVLDSKLPEEQAIIEKLPRIGDHLCAACREHFAQLQNELAQRGIAYEINWRLVRGLDYYMRTTFEITAPGLGAQNAVCGGGRYDGLVELLGGPKFRHIKGVGFAIGQDRLIDALDAQKQAGAGARTQIDVLVAWKDSAAREDADRVARLLRDSGLVVEVPVKPLSPQEGLGLANRLGIPIGVVVGPDEVKAKAFSVRFLSEGKQFSIEHSMMKRLTQTSWRRRLLVFRVLLERELAQMAIFAGVDYKNVPPEKLADNLVAAGQLAADLKGRISTAMKTFSRIVSGEDVDDDDLSEAVSASVLVIDELSRHTGTG